MFIFLESVMKGLLVLLFGFGIYSIIWNIYLFFVSISGFGEISRDYNIKADETRFLLLVAANNEENVIGSTVDSLRNIDYDKDLCEIIIINDNCTDKTGEICKSKGVRYVNTSLEKFEREGIGKPGGIQYALRDIGFKNIMKNYDLVMIFDADNHVSSNILKEVNSQFIDLGKPEAIQVYIDSKNSTSLVSLGYSMSFFVSNRFNQYAKYKKGLPVYLGGTGFAIRSDYLISKGGFKCQSLTEDLEFAVDIWLDGGKVVWNHFASVYDEKPDKLGASVRQRTRWCKGHAYVAIKKFKLIMKQILKGKDRKIYIDLFIHLFSIGRSIQYIILLFGFLISVIGLNINSLSKYFNMFSNELLSSIAFGGLIGIMLLIYNYGILPYYALKKDFHKKIEFKHILALLIYSFSFIYPQIKGLMKWKNQKVWIKTQHIYSERIEDNKEVYVHER